MTTTPGADERRIFNGLRALGVSYAPQPPAVDPDAWWDELYADDDGVAGNEPAGWTLRPSTWKRPDPDLDDDDPDDDWEQAEDPEPATRPPSVRTAARTRTRRAQATFAGLEHRTRWLTHYGAAAGLGWGLGLEPLLGGWITEAGHDTGNTGTALIVGTSLIIAAGLAAWRTRMWWPPLAWCCRIPVASAALALALYAPGVTP